MEAKIESHASWCPGGKVCACSLDLLGAALSLVMQCNGSMDALGLVPELPAALRWRVDNWRPSFCAWEEGFDSAVKQVVIEALKVYDASHRPAFFASADWRPEAS